MAPSLVRPVRDVADRRFVVTLSAMLAADTRADSFVAVANVQLARDAAASQSPAPIPSWLIAGASPLAANPCGPNRPVLMLPQ
jgi:hypothetical protein